MRIHPRNIICGGTYQAIAGQIVTLTTPDLAATTADADQVMIKTDPTEIDKRLGYAPGMSLAEFFAGDLGREYPVAILDEPLCKILKAAQPVVILSRATIDEHRHHPEIGATDYAIAQRIVDEGEIYEQESGRLIMLWRHGETLYRAALKRTRSGDKNYWLSLFLTNDDLALTQVVRRFNRIR